MTLNKMLLRTASGIDVPLWNVQPQHIRLRDMAHHLAQLNLYNGACQVPYSIAAHQLLIVDILEANRQPAQLCILGLLTGANAAYYTSTGYDGNRNAFSSVRAAAACQQRIEQAIHRACGTYVLHCNTSDQHRQIINFAQDVAAVTAWRDMMPGPLPGGMPQVNAHPVQVRPLNWSMIEENWLDKFDRLAIMSGVHPHRSCYP